jgi:uracil-DNA glycosylase family 4
MELAELNEKVTACRLCPRLVEFREKVSEQRQARYRDWEYWGRPLPGFGDPNGRLLIVGLAPAAHGGNRTGRMFTGDGSANFLVSALYRAGFASQPTSRHRGDGLSLLDCYITAVVRCPPPQNRPTPQEIANCRQYLLEEMALLPRIRAVLVLGRVAFQGYLAALRQAGYPVKRISFFHGAEYPLGPNLPRLFCSYHPSRQNTQTGRLTAPMLDEVLSSIADFLHCGP